MIFGRMIKADAAQRRIYARLDETPDRSRMVLDYAMSKPQFEGWSESMRKASGGKNFGNVRAQHGLQIAGLVEQIDFDDEKKTIDFMIKVTSDQVWNDVEQGVYTGISQGGSYGKRWNDGAYTRYEAKPEELSLVDRPGNPNATFTMVKAAGGEEERKFNPGDTLGKLAETLIAAGSGTEQRQILTAEPAQMIKAIFGTDEMRAIAEAGGLKKRDYSGDEREAMAKKGQAMEDGSFPIADKEDLDNAVQASGRAKDKDAAKAHITKRAKALDATDALPEDWDGSTKKKDEKPMKKSIGDIGQLAALVQGLCWFATCCAQEALAEGDQSPLPARAAAAVEELSSILADYASEEAKEEIERLKGVVGMLPKGAVMEKTALAGDMLPGAGNMKKAGARHSKEDLARVQSIHDTARDLGADCAGNSDGGGDARMMKAVLDLGSARDEMKKLAGALATAHGRIKELEAKPAGGGPVRSGTAVDRGGDGADTLLSATFVPVPAEIEAMPAGPDKTRLLIRHAMENPEPPSAPRRNA